MVCVFAVHVSILGVHGPEIVTLVVTFSFDTAFLSLILDGSTLTLELCNDPEVATLEALFHCLAASGTVDRARRDRCAPPIGSFR